MSRTRFVTPTAIEHLGNSPEAGPLRELALHRWIDRVLRSNSVDRALDRLLDAVLDGLSIRFGLVGHVDQDGALRVLTMRATHSTSSAAPQEEQRVAPNVWREALDLVCKRQCSVLCGPLPLPGEFQTSDVMAAAPLVFQGDVIGLLAVGPRMGTQRHDLDLLEAAASRMSPVLDAAIHREKQTRRETSMRMQLLQSQRMEAIGQLAGGIAHDFNNLLTAILGYCNLVAFDLDDASPVQADLHEIRKAAEQAASLTRQLLTFSRRQPRQSRLVDINEIVEGLESMLRRLLVETVELTSDLAPNLGWVHADPAQIERMLVNLVVNARDAMPEGGHIRIQTRNLELSEPDDGLYMGLEPGSYVLLVVSDTGEGMDAQTQLRVFEPFFTTKPEGKGTGLGLATVYGVVKQAGGEIWIDSAPGEGSHFRICLPRHLAESDAELDPESGLYSSPYRGDETILLVEDDDQVITLTSRILERFGYVVLTAPDARTALSLAEQHPGPIHALLSDVVMPEVSGPKLATSFRPLRPQARIMFMSGHPEEELDQHLRASGPIPLISKPFKPLELARFVRKQLDTSVRLPGER